MYSSALLLALAALACTERAAGVLNVHSLHKRDAVLGTLTIPLTVTKDLRYVVGVNMSSSPETQRFKFALAGNTGYSAVAGVACDSCNNVPSYNQSASLSQKPLPGSQNVSLGAASVSGPFTREDCGLHQANGSTWLYPNQTIIVANSSSLFSGVTSGIFGLGTNANGQAGSFDDTIFGGWLSRNPSRNNFTFGMDLRPPSFTSDDDTGNGGVLHWVEPDSTAFQGNVAWSPASVAATAPDESSGVSSDNTLGLPESDWVIDLDSWTGTVSGAVVGNSTKNQAVLEPFFPNIYFPAHQANMLYSSVPGAALVSTAVNEVQVWSVPCNADLTVAFTFAGQGFPVGQDQLILRQSDGSCVGAIQAFPDASVSSFVFGSNFISAFYLIFVVGRPGSGVPNQIGIGMRASIPAHKNTGAIAGGVVGGVIVLCVLLAAAFFFGRRSRKSRATPGVTNGEKYDNDKETDGGHDGAQYAAVPVSNRGSQFSTPLPSAISATSSHPLLPEQQSPNGRAFSVPGSPMTPVNFLSVSSPGSTRGHGEGSSASHSISYNSSAIGANMDASRATSAYGIDPYVLPPMSSPTGQPGLTRASKVQHWQPPQEQAEATSPQDIDPLSPSTTSTRLYRPLVLAPPPRGAMRPGSTSPSVPSRRMETPAPPYAESGTEVTSPTLIDHR